MKKKIKFSQIFFFFSYIVPFSSASICSGVNDVRFRCNFRFKRKRAAESTSEPSCCDESSVLESISIGKNN